MIQYELLTAENFQETALDDFCRTQKGQNIYQNIHGCYTLVREPFVADWGLEKKRAVARELLHPDCIAYLAAEDGRILGFIGLVKNLMGNRMILNAMQVTSEARRQGLGRKLFQLAAETARQAGAKELYLSACPAEETIAFYKAMGAELAADPIRELAEEEPFDLQMVYRLD